MLVKLIPIEVKYKDNTYDKDMKTVIRFCIKNNLNMGFILSKDIEEDKIISRDGKKIMIRIIPVWKWLLSINKAKIIKEK